MLFLRKKVYEFKNRVNLNIKMKKAKVFCIRFLEKTRKNKLGIIIFSFNGHEENINRRFI